MEYGINSGLHPVDQNVVLGGNTEILVQTFSDMQVDINQLQLQLQE
jgi:hypothetical protein